MTTVVLIVLIKLRKVVLRMDRTGNPIARFVYLAHHSKTSFKTFGSNGIIMMLHVKLEF